MGIFSFKGGNRDVETVNPAAKTAVPAADEMNLDADRTPSGTVDLPKLDVGMQIDIMEESGAPRCSGVITEYRGRQVTIGRVPGALSFKIAETGSPLFVRGCDSNMTQFYLRAKVVESTRTMMKLGELEPEVRDNQRKNFRLMLNVPISIYYANDERMERPENCTLVDLSTEGCCIQTEYLHGEGEVLRLKIKLDDYVPMDFIGEIIRVNDYGSNGIQCGILFAQLKPEETENLTKMLFNIQLGNRREHSRSANGHW